MNRTAIFSIVVSSMAISACGAPKERAPASHDTAGMTKVAGRAAPVRAADVLALIRDAGPHSAVAFYFGNTPRETFCGEAVEDSIGQGDSVWLDIAVKLAPGADACSGESLRDGLAMALARSPARVLRLVGPHFSLEDVCSLPFYDDTPDSLVAAHQKRVIAALRNMTDSSLAGERDACIKFLSRVHLSDSSSTPR